MFTSAFSLAEFSFPSGLSTSQAEKLVDTFGVGFIGKWPTSFSQNKYRTQLNVSWNQINTKEVAKLGSGTEDELVQYQEFHFTQTLPYQVDIGLRASLLGLDNSMNTYGGFVRWGFYSFPFGRIAFGVHATSANYRSLMSVNLYGTVLETDFYLKNFVLTTGIGQLRSTAAFQAKVFGINTAGGDPQVHATKTYGHQFIRASYLMGQWNIGVQSDYIRDSYTALIVGYVF